MIKSATKVKLKKGRWKYFAKHHLAESAYGCDMICYQGLYRAYTPFMSKEIKKKGLSRRYYYFTLKAWGVNGFSFNNNI